MEVLNHLGFGRGILLIVFVIGLVLYSLFKRKSKK